MTRIGPHGASAGTGDPCWFMKRTKAPSRSSGSQAGEPGLRASVIVRQTRLSKGGPLQSAPWMGSPIISKSSADPAEFIAPRLRPCRYSFGRRSLGRAVQYS
ncbi:hypothetical protein D3C72_1791000 [compost metagenome]